MFIGLEKENLIFDENFKNVVFNKSELPENITLDYSDNQIEFVSGVHKNSVSLIKEMYDLMDNEIFKDKYIWPFSMPGINDYNPTHLGFLGDDLNYRLSLKDKYDKNLLNTSGIHFNFSFEEDLDEEFYFNMLKKIYVFGPLLLQFVAYTPFYQNKMNDHNLDFINQNKGYKNSISLRNTNDYGYYNEHKLDFDYTTLDSYKKSIKDLINDGILLSEKEIYSKVRLKKANNKHYLELRFIDINPFNRLGISIDAIDNIMVFLNYIKDIDIIDFDIKTCQDNFDLVAKNGRDKQIKLSINKKVDTLENHTLSLLENMCNCSGKKHCVIDNIKSNYISNNTYIERFIKLLETNTVLDLGKQMAYKKEVYSSNDDLKDLELSTQILINEAVDMGFEVSILDRFANAIEIKNKNKSEIIFQATKTNLDKYSNVLVMENKLLTKYVLDQAKIHTPKGIDITLGEEYDISIFNNKPIVIKPVDTNFGLGITILKDYNKSDVDDAVLLAFSHSNKIIIEEFFDGVEYRLLVIGDEVVSIVNRVAAHVVGDGIHTVKQLVDLKNENPLRGSGYVLPLEKLKLSDFELNFIKNQGHSVDDILDVGQILYLRENSNVSTGGDSLEVFDVIPSRFKEIALSAAKTLDVKICGIDMIINDDFTDYTIIEANFNPAIQMHTYPLLGFGKNVASKILDLLFKDEDID